MDSFAEDRKQRVGPTPEDQQSQVARGWKPSMDKPLPTVQCTETTETGRRCNAWGIQGSDKCHVHATNLDKKRSAELVQAGRLRLIGLIDPAIDTLQELLSPGTGEATRLKAATEILDRSGIVKGQDINVQIETTNRGAEMVAEKLAAIRERKQADAEIIEVSEVEEDADSS